MADEIVIGKLIIDNTDLDRALIESKKAIIDLENEQKQLKKDTDNLSSANKQQLTTFVSNEASLKKLRSEYSANQKSVLDITKAQTGLDAALKLNIKSQADAIANTKALTEARRQIDTTTVEGAKAISDINTKIDANNKLINGSSSALEQQKINIGNYPTLMNAVNSSFGGATQTIIGFAQKGKDAIGELSSIVTNFQSVQQNSQVATEAYAAAQIAETAATEAATLAETQRVAIGFQYAAGQATETEVEAANTAATVANAGATAAQATAQEAATAATTVGTVATRALTIAMLAIPIIAIVAAFTTLIGILSSTREGMGYITAVTRPLIAIFESLWGVIQNMTLSLVDAFSNPKKVLVDLADFVKNNLINRFKAFGVILDGIINLDFKKVANGVIQAGTGVENMTGKIQNASQATSKFLAEAAAKGAALDVLEKSLSKTRNANVLLLGAATEEVKAQNRIAEDQTKTSKEREIATQKSIVAVKEINRLKNKELDIEISILKNKQSRNDTSAAETKELNELIAKKNENNAAELELETTQNNKLVSIRKAASDKVVANRKAAHDLELKNAQSRIDILKLESSQENLSVEKRIENANKIFDLENSLAKKSSTGLDQQKILIQNRQELSSSILSIADSQIAAEIEQQKKKFTDVKKITEAQRDAEISSANDLATAQIGLLDKNLLTEKAYADEVTKINQGKNDSVAIANKTFDEAELIRKTTAAANEKALSDVSFQIKLQDLTDQGLTESELKQAILTEQYKQEQKLLDEQEQKLLVEQPSKKLILHELYNAKKLLSDKKYKSDTAANDKIIAAQKEANNINMLKNGVGALTALFSESKALSVAGALINTYQGISAGVKLGYPAAIPAVAMAASTGFEAVKNILKTNKNSTSGSDTPTQTTTGSGSFVNQAQTSTIATVSDRPVEQNTVVTPPVLVLETLQEVQTQQKIKINSN